VWLLFRVTVLGVKTLVNTPFWLWFFEVHTRKVDWGKVVAPLNNLKVEACLVVELLILFPFFLLGFLRDKGLDTAAFEIDALSDHVGTRFRFAVP
jgi:hypothetical protein